MATSTFETLPLEVMDFTDAERERFSLIPGDLLVCEGGEVGRTAIWNGEIQKCYFQKAIHRLRPISYNIIPGFMLRFMRYSSNIGWFNDYISQTSIAHLTQEKLAQLPIPLPKLYEQDVITVRFDSIDNQLNTELSYLDKLSKFKTGLMQDLLTGNVRVTVDEVQETLA